MGVMRPRADVYKRQAHREGYPEIGLYWEKAALEEAEHAAKFAELLGEVLTLSLIHISGAQRLGRGRRQAAAVVAAGFPIADGAAPAPCKRFAGGKTLPRAEFTSARAG